MGIEITIDGIELEINKKLALRKYGAECRRAEECLPQKIEKGVYYKLLKKGRRIFPLEKEIPLVQTYGGQKLSDPIAKVLIFEPKHVLRNGLWTIGEWVVTEIIDKNYSEKQFPKKDITSGGF